MIDRVEGFLGVDEEDEEFVIIDFESFVEKLVKISNVVT